jgi:hypothetical protein
MELIFMVHRCKNIKFPENHSRKMQGGNRNLSMMNPRGRIPRCPRRGKRAKTKNPYWGYRMMGLNFTSGCNSIISAE